MKITKVNDTQLKIENHVKGLEVLDCFDIIENNFKASFIINKEGLPCLKYDRGLYNFTDDNFTSLINCNSILLDKINVKVGK